MESILRNELGSTFGNSSRYIKDIHIAPLHLPLYERSLAIRQTFLFFFGILYWFLPTRPAPKLGQKRDVQREKLFPQAAPKQKINTQDQSLRNPPQVLVSTPRLRATCCVQRSLPVGLICFFPPFTSFWLKSYHDAVILRWVLHSQASWREASAPH